MSVAAAAIIGGPIAYETAIAATGDGIHITQRVDITEVHEAAINSTFANNQVMVKLNSTYYAVFYTDDSGDGAVTNIGTGDTLAHTESAPYTNDGAWISTATADAYTFNATDATHISADKINDTAAVVAYTGNGDDGHLVSVSIDDVTITVGPMLEYDLTATENAVIRLNYTTNKAGTTGMVAYADGDSDGVVKNWLQDSTGMNTTVSLEFANGDTVSSIALAKYNDTAAVAVYKDADSDGQIEVFNYEGVGAASIASIGYDGTPDTTGIEFATDNDHNALIQVFNNTGWGNNSTYAVAYQGGSGDGFLETFTVTPESGMGGGVTIRQVDIMEFDTADASNISIAEVSDHIFAIAYSGTDTAGCVDSDCDGDGIIKTFYIHTNGAIGPTSLQDVEFDTTGANSTSVIHHDADSVLVSYVAEDGTSAMATFTITTQMQQLQAWEDVCNVRTGEGGAASLDPFADTAIDCTKGKTGHSNDKLFNLAPLLDEETKVAMGLNAAYIPTSTVIANPGDTVKVSLNIHDDDGAENIHTVALYTNFGERPSDMNYYFANNYNEAGETSKTMYEWNKLATDKPYDITQSVTWEEPTIITNEDGSLTITFVTTWNEAMPESEITAKIIDAEWGMTKVTLPFKLKVGDYHETYQEIFGINPDYRVATSVAEPLVIAEMQNWNMDTYGELRTEYDTNGAELLNILGLSGQSLPEWTKNLSQWALDDQIDIAELIIALEYLSNTVI